MSHNLNRYQTRGGIVVHIEFTPNSEMVRVYCQGYSFTLEKIIALKLFSAAP